jgi:hypothetical protein
MDIRKLYSFLCVRLKVVIQSLAGSIAKRRSNPQLPDPVVAETA